MKEKYIVWHIEGGLGKNVAATALISSLKEKYNDRQIIVVASYPDVFLNHPDIYRVYRVGATMYFYDDYIKDKDTLIFKHEPYFETHHILQNKHLLANWCKLMDIEYKFQLPFINFNFTQKRNFSKWNREKPILLLQTNGGPLDQSIISTELFSLVANSDKRILIDSCLQHAAAAFDLKSTVFWVGTSPKNFGYSLHDNIVANKPTTSVKLPNSYLFDYGFEGAPYECPYMSLEEMFDIDQIIKDI